MRKRTLGYFMKYVLLHFSTIVVVAQGTSTFDLSQAFKLDNFNKESIKIEGATLVGTTNKAVFFDGVNDYIALNSPSLNSYNDFSIAMWVAPVRFKLAAAWVSKSNLNNSKSQFRFGFGWPANSELNATFYDNFWQDQSFKYALPLYQWTHLVYTISPKNKKGQLFINGNLEYEYSLTEYMPSTEPVFLGLQWDDYIFYHGYIDEVAVFNKVVSEKEVGKLYDVFTKTSKIDIKPNASKTEKKYTYSIPKQQNDAIEVGDLREENCDFDAICAIVENQLTDSASSLESFLIYKGDKLVLEEYFHGYTAETLHGLSSITKSFTSALLGIAIDNKFIKSEKESLLSFYPVKHSNPSLDSITLQHVLNHKSGILPVAIPYQLRTKDDWVQNILANQVQCKIGEFKYHELNPEIIIHTLVKNTAISDVEFANTYLFEPLGIDNYSWLKDQTGIIDGGTGLILRPRDMLKFGIMYKNEGVFAGKRIISKEWIRKSTSKEITDFKYNYYWWRFNENIKGQEIYGYSATGFGGQNITIVPKLDLVIVVTNSPSGSGINSAVLIKKFIVPLFAADNN